MQLYEALLERDVPAIRAAVSEFRTAHSSGELFESVARFAILAYAPSQHGKHALIACASAHQLDASDDLLTECAIYAAAARQPWSEPPITDPPAIESNQRGDIDELREAVQAEDRLRGERWLAKRIDDDGSALFLVASDSFEDLGHKLIVTATAWKLASLFDPRGRFATLRVAVSEMTAYRGERYEEQGVALDTETLLGRLIESMIAGEGDIISAHAIFLLDAALQTAHADVIRRVRDYLTTFVEDSRPQLSAPAKAPVVQVKPYNFARDYGALLKAHAVAKRLQPRYPSVDFDGMIAAAAYNLEHAPSFEEFSFA